MITMPAKELAAQHNVCQFLVADQPDDVLNARVNCAIHQVGALAEASECRRIDLMLR
ncbi:MAG: hypothetical protein ABSC06_14325 [Rhodopila sp.]